MPDLVTIKPHDKTTAQPPGTWRYWLRRVFVSCPQCGDIASLDHEVHADGRVAPSLDCPNDDCTWHVFARLDGWIAGYLDLRTS